MILETKSYNFISKPPHYILEGEAKFSTEISGLLTPRAREFVEKEFKRLEEKYNNIAEFNSYTASSIATRHFWSVQFFAKFSMQVSWYEKEELEKYKEILMSTRITEFILDNSQKSKIEWHFSDKQAKLIEDFKEIRKRAREIDEEEREAKIFGDFDAIMVDTVTCDKLPARKYYMKRFRGGNWLVVKNTENGILRVPKNIAGHVIGKGGKRIKRIEEVFGKRFKLEIL